MNEGTYRPPSRQRWLLPVMVVLLILTILLAWALMQSRVDRGEAIPEPVPPVPTAMQQVAGLPA